MTGAGPAGGTSSQSGAPQGRQGALSTQLNIVTTLDVGRILRTGTLAGALYMFDNDPRSAGKGGSALTTHCYPGQVLNWLIYTVSPPEAGWPGMPWQPAPVPRIVNLTFLYGSSDIPSWDKVCDDLKVYGAPDRLRSPLTPVYQYWAGTVRPQVQPGNYRYRMMIGLPAWPGGPTRYLELSTMSLQVVAHPVTEVNPSGSGAEHPAGGQG